MSLIKVAIYVEGRTEQLLLNHFIKVWWNYEMISIKNIKLIASEENKTELQDFNTTNPRLFFLIVDVSGSGSLPSAIANRYNGHKKESFIILALRDLKDDEFKLLPKNIDRQSQVEKIIIDAISKVNLSASKETKIFFSVMEIETWLLAFPKAVSIWLEIEETEIRNRLNSYASLEVIKNPASLLEKMAKSCNKKYEKKIGQVTKILSQIERKEIEAVFKSKEPINFNKFWNYLLQLCH